MSVMAQNLMSEAHVSMHECPCVSGPIYVKYLIPPALIRNFPVLFQVLETP
jgi:hypothetical protein